MVTSRLMVTFKPEETAALDALCALDRRPPKFFLRYLVIQEASRRGLLAPSTVSGAIRDIIGESIQGRDEDLALEAIRYVWNESKQSGNSLLVLLAIATQMNQYRRAYLSVATLASMAKISVRQTQRIIKQLCEDQELQVIRPGEGVERPGPGMKTQYRICGFSDNT